MSGTHAFKFLLLGLAMAIVRTEDLKDADPGSKRAAESILETVVQQQASMIQILQTDLAATKTRLTALENAQHQAVSGRGTTYIRWGHEACPDPSTTVYSGFVGGSWYDNSGSAANYLCLPHDPIIEDHVARDCANTALHGAEYDTCDSTSHDMDPVCALCHIPRSASTMIAGTNRCWNGWNLEYSGYLMAGYQGNGGASEFICVDRSLGYVFGSSANENGRLLHHAIYYCGSLLCPPYRDRKTVLCAVCSK